MMLLGEWVRKENWCCGLRRLAGFVAGMEELIGSCFTVL